MVAHQGVCNLVEAQKEAFRIGEWSRVLQFASISFDASVSEIFCTLTAGGSLHVYERENLMPGDDLLRVLREDQITAVTLPPTVLAALKEEELRHLQTVIAAGEACSAEIVERWGRGRRFLDAYGPTESTVCATIGECELGSRRKPSIGGPVANMRLYILDRELEPAPIGVRGELLIAGVGLARGYWGRPDLTAEKFIPDSFDGSGGRLYRTGDLGRYSPAGCIEFAGRIDHQIKIRGYRIEPAEIECVLMQAPSIRECIVIASEDESSEKRLVAYLVVEEEFSGTTLELRQFLRQRLPAYFVPSSFVVLDSLPLSPNGKVDRNALPAPGEQDV
jgi:amino acid adenylation domain-containing protein